MDAWTKVAFVFVCQLFCCFRPHVCQIKQTVDTVTLFEKTQQTEVLQTVTSCKNAKLRPVQANQVSTTALCTNCFQAVPSGTDTYNVQFLPLAPLDHNLVQTYRVTVECTADNGTLEKIAVVNVIIEPNLAPFFTDSYATEVSTIAQLSSSGLNISRYCQDNNVGKSQDSLTFTLLSLDPPSTALQLSYDGILKAQTNLNAVCRRDFAFTVGCEDRYQQQASGTLTVALTISDGKEVPSIGGINYALDVQENTVAGTSVASLTVYNGGSSPTCTLSADSSYLRQFFELEGSGVSRDIEMRGQLNYEGSSSTATNLTVTCRDGSCTSPEAYLYVTVIDLNEPLTLYPTDVTLSTYEGQITVDPKWMPADEDRNDIVTYTLLGSNTFFTIDPVTGIINSTLVYDTDGGAMPTTQVLVVQAEDRAGHTSSSSVTLSILDSNDNRPEFVDTAQSVTISGCTATSGTTVASVNATDRDSSFQGNDAVSYSLTGGPFRVDGAGNVVISGSVTSGVTYFLQVMATDAGVHPNPLTSASAASITVHVTACSTPAPTPGPAATTTPAPGVTTPPPGPPVATPAPTVASPAPTVASPGPTVTLATGGGNSTGSGGEMARTLPSDPNALSSLDENVGWLVVAALPALVLLVAVVALIIWRCSHRSPYKPRSSSRCRDLCQPRPSSKAVHPAKGMVC